MHARYTRTNSPRCTPASAQVVYHMWLATHKRWCDTGHTTILTHQTWIGCNRWYGCKRQKNTNNISNEDTDIEPTAQQPYRNQEDKVICLQISILGRNECQYRKHNKPCSTCLEYQDMQLQEKIILPETLVKPWQVVGTDIFVVNNEMLLCIVNYFSKMPVLKKVKNMLAEDLIWATTLIFAEFSLPNCFSFRSKFCFITV